MAAGWNHTCFLRSDGTVVACGFNESGECDIPPPLVPQHVYIQVSAGYNHTVLLRKDGSVIAVGQNQYGQCDIPAGEYKWVAAGRFCTVLLRRDGQLVFLGEGCDNVKLPQQKKYTQVRASFDTSSLCTVALLCAGGTAVILQLPQPLARPMDLYMCSNQTAGHLTQVCVGTGHEQTGVIVHLRRDGTAFASGCNAYHQCDIPTLDDYKMVSTSGHHTVLLRRDGTAVALGFNGYGQCVIPELEEGVRYEAVLCGGRHTVLLRSDGEAVAFGDNDYGQCGDGRVYTGVCHCGSLWPQPLYQDCTPCYRMNGIICYLDSVTGANLNGPHDWLRPAEDTESVNGPHSGIRPAEDTDSLREDNPSL